MSMAGLGRGDSVTQTQCAMLSHVETRLGLSVLLRTPTLALLELPLEIEAGDAHLPGSWKMQVCGHYILGVSLGLESSP